jgi:enoyl-CoA hydratase
MSNDVLIRAATGVMVIEICRPEARNAINLSVARSIAAALKELDADKNLSVGVITGSGAHFCAGMDLKAFVDGELPIVEGAGFAGITDAPPRKPLIAAVEGYALAGGFEIVLSCDLVVASSSARFGIPEVKRGLVACCGGLLRLPRRLPYHLAMELALTGEPLTAERAHGHGLVNRLVAEGDALEEALALAHQIATNGPLAVQASKHVIANSHDWPVNEMFQLQGPYTDHIPNSQDALEGARAFAEKRKPVWRGC